METSQRGPVMQWSIIGRWCLIAIIIALAMALAVDIGDSFRFGSPAGMADQPQVTKQLTLYLVVSHPVNDMPCSQANVRLSGISSTWQQRGRLAWGGYQLDVDNPPTGGLIAELWCDGQGAHQAWNITGYPTADISLSFVVDANGGNGIASRYLAPPKHA